MVTTLTDVAQELNWSYFQAKRNNLKSTKDKSIFVDILKNLYEIYGVYFGYEHSQRGLSNFKSDVIQAKNYLKKFKKNFSPKLSWYEYQNPRELWKGSKLESTSAPFEEGDVVWEAENWGTEDPFN